MSKLHAFRKGQIVAISALFAATFGLFGCGDDSSSDSSPSKQTATCTVSKSSTAVTVKKSNEGVNTTIVYAFNKEGKKVSETQIITMPDESNATAKASCKALDQDEEGVEVEFEDGACTITTTKGLSGTLDKTYKEQQEACDEFESGSESSEKDSKEKDGPSKTISSLTKLYSTKCEKSNANEIVAVKDESTDYICAKIDLAGVATYMWAPAVDKIDDMPKCTKKWATANPKLIYAYDTSDEKFYTCSEDEDSKWAWTALKVSEKKKDSEEKEGEVGEEEGDDEGDDEGGSEGDSEGDDEGDDEGDNSSSSSKAKSSSSAAADDKSVTFKDDVLWDPSYASRARTFFNTVSADNFLEDNEVTGDSSGWWFKYLDDADYGTSTAVGKFTDAALNLNITLNYKGWHLEGTSAEGYLAPDPYPYAGFGFSWSPNGEAESVDLSDWEGICMTYDATDYFEVAFQAEGDGGLSYYYLAAPTSSAKTVNIAFSSLIRSEYAKTTLSKAEALGHATSFQIKYTNDETEGISYYCNRLYGDTAARCNSAGISATNTINIYKIGKYGTCGGVSTTL